MCFLTAHVYTGIGEVGERNWKSSGIIYMRMTKSGYLVFVDGGVLVVVISSSG
jgi:hypothetical protein